jgi:hypothetical protein
MASKKTKQLQQLAEEALELRGAAGTPFLPPRQVLPLAWWLTAEVLIACGEGRLY